MTDPVAERIRAAAEGVEAPQRLRETIEARRAAPARRPMAVALAFGLAMALIVVSLAGLLGGGPEGPGVDKAVDAALAAPEQPPRAGNAIDGLAFPDAAYENSWRQVGRNEGRVEGRRALTVTYGRGSRRVGYTIVAAPALRVPGGARRVRRGGILYAVLGSGDRAAVTWQRDGHTCVLAGRGVPVEQLLRFVRS